MSITVSRSQGREKRKDKAKGGDGEDIESAREEQIEGYEGGEEDDCWLTAMDGDGGINLNCSAGVLQPASASARKERGHRRR